MQLGELLVLLGQGGLEFRVSALDETPYLFHPLSGGFFPLPLGGINERIEPELIAWIVELTGVAPDLDLLQDPKPDG